jgi:hypothetical protein
MSKEDAQIADITRKIVDQMRPDELDAYVYNELYAKLLADPGLIPKYIQEWKLNERQPNIKDSRGVV